tara:strand:+ start:5190 stop:5819 length:630 start_codon:yes stop_codon:yes gene_type:complete
LYKYFHKENLINTKSSQITSKNKGLYYDKSLFIKISISIILIIATSIFAQMRFFIPGNPVPITFQTLGILLMGGILGPKWGLGSILAYVVIGIAGLPVFQGGNGGLDYITGVTGGYIIGFILASTSVGFLTKIGLNKSKSIWAYIIGTILVYIPAIIWLSIFDFGWPKQGMMLSEAVYPFLIGDMIKAIVASLFTVAIGYTNLQRFINK